MPRSKLANEEVREKQRGNIMSAARKTFVAKGSHATIADIAAEAGISQGLLYRYYTSKEELLFSIMRDLIDRASSPNVSTSKIPGTPFEKIRAIVSKVISSRRNEPFLYQFIFQALVDEKTPEEIRQKVKSQGLELEEAVRELIVEGQNSGEVSRDDPDVLVSAIFGCIEGIWRRMVYSDSIETGDYFPDSEIILRMLKPS